MKSSVLKWIQDPYLTVKPIHLLWVFVEDTFLLWEKIKKGFCKLLRLYDSRMMNEDSKIKNKIAELLRWSDKQNNETIKIPRVFTTYPHRPRWRKIIIALTDLTVNYSNTHLIISAFFTLFHSDKLLFIELSQCLFVIYCGVSIVRPDQFFSVTSCFSCYLNDELRLRNTNILQNFRWVMRKSHQI